MESDARRKLEYFRQLAHDVPVDLLLERGPIAETLLAVAESQHVDLIVAGTQGYGRMERLLLGSVAEKLSRQSPCPVVVVPEAAASYDVDFHLRTVLCPTNFSERSQAALKQAWDLATGFSARILLLHVVEDSGLSRADRIEQNNAVENRLIQITSSLLSGKVSPEVEFVVEFGPIAQTIIRVSAEREANLVVLSIQRDKPVVAHLPPEITYSVAQRVSCPVLTIAG
jgi:nucleotide-binding universal stress UspA family protein